MIVVLSVFPMATLRAQVSDMEESVRMAHIMEMIADTNASIDTVWMLLAGMTWSGWKNLSESIGKISRISFRFRN